MTPTRRDRSSTRPGCRGRRTTRRSNGRLKAQEALSVEALKVILDDEKAKGNPRPKNGDGDWKYGGLVRASGRFRGWMGSANAMRNDGRIPYESTERAERQGRVRCQAVRGIEITNEGALQIAVSGRASGGRGGAPARVWVGPGSLHPGDEHGHTAQDQRPRQRTRVRRTRDLQHRARCRCTNTGGKAHSANGESRTRRRCARARDGRCRRGARRASEPMEPTEKQTSERQSGARFAHQSRGSPKGPREEQRSPNRIGL